VTDPGAISECQRKLPPQLPAFGQRIALRLVRCRLTEPTLLRPALVAGFFLGADEP